MRELAWMIGKNSSITQLLIGNQKGTQTGTDAEMAFAMSLENNKT
jgi:hypothetical protein